MTDTHTPAASAGPAEPTRVFLAGAGGQVGTEFQALASDHGFDLRTFDRKSLDITDTMAVEAAVTAFRPDWIVNAAAYTAVDQAEKDADAAYAVNRDGVACLARAARGAGARMVHVSTDYVFDGTLGRPYPPDYPPAPLGIYGKSKHAGETEVLRHLGDAALILRTSWVYADHGRNFLLTMLRLLGERNELRVVEDQVGSPTRAGSLARVIAAAIRENVWGIHHWTDAGVASWYDFAVAIRDEGMRAGLLGHHCDVVPISTEDYPTPAPRPPCSLLDKASLRSLIGFPGRHWREELRATIEKVAESRFHPGEA